MFLRLDVFRSLRPGVKRHVEVETGDQAAALAGGRVFSGFKSAWSGLDDRHGKIESELSYHDGLDLLSPKA